MIVTEAEAKTKRCQESFAAADGLSHEGMIESGATVAVHAPPAPYQSFGSSMTVTMSRTTAPSHCIGSACMAWRWHDPSTWQGPPNAMSSAPPDQWKGFCGKAGT